MHVESSNELNTVRYSYCQKVEDKHYSDAYLKNSVPVPYLEYK